MNIIIQCDGGLCNRINNLINGIYLSQLLNRKLYVWWDLNQACHCPLEKLFTNDFNTAYKEIWSDDFVYYTPFNTTKRQDKNSYGELKFRLTFKYDDYPYMYNRLSDNLNLKSSEIISELKSIQSATLVFSSSLILTEIIPESFIRKTLASLISVPEVNYEMNAALKNDNIDSSVTGIHLRRTDYNLLDDGYIIDLINRYLKLDNKKRFLVCSDSSATEQKFKNLYPNNVILVNNKSFIEKINEKKSDQEFSNLMRSEKSVQSALVDIYLLAHTSFTVFSPVSTFAQTIFRLNKALK